MVQSNAEITKQGSMMVGKQAMKLNYYPETDSLYIDLIDIQNASQHTDLTQLDIADLPARIIAKTTEAA